MTRRSATAVALTLLAIALAAGCGRRAHETTVVAHRLVSVTQTDAVDVFDRPVPTATDTVRLWLGPGLARRDNHDGSLLVDMHRQLLTMVRPADRSYVQGTSAEISRQLAALAADPERSDDRQVRRLKSLLQVSARVTDTGKVADIDGYRCRRWIVEQRFGEQTTLAEVWLTGDLDVDFSLLQRTTQPALAALPGGEAALAELAKLRGVPVLTSSVLTVLGRETRTETRLVATGLDTVPVSFFAPPPGFRDRAANSQ
ncbi:MAG: DUF4412 domain-containing protein [Candidatus Krumholzibacteriia bacterium]